MSQQGFPKPRPRVVDRVAVKQKRDRRSQAFRQAVWQRDGGRCRHCGRLVRRTLELVPDRGEVHHRQTRGAHPDRRYDVANGVLLCAVCHQQAQRHEITV